MKRCIGGTYVSVEPFHLFRYLDEETFRFNQRKRDSNLSGIGMLHDIVESLFDGEENIVSHFRRER